MYNKINFNVRKIKSDPFFFTLYIEPGKVNANQDYLLSLFLCRWKNTANSRQVVVHKGIENRLRRGMWEVKSRVTEAA